MMKLDYSKKPSLTQLLLIIFSPKPGGLPGAGGLDGVLGVAGIPGRSLVTPRSRKKAELSVLGDVGFWLPVCVEALPGVDPGPGSSDVPILLLATGKCSGSQFFSLGCDSCIAGVVSGLQKRGQLRISWHLGD